MNKASPVELRQSLEMANSLASEGIRFVPVPVINDAEFNRLVDESMKIIDGMLVDVEHDTTNQQFESLTKSEQLPVHINYKCALCGARFSGDVWMTRHQRRRYTTGAKIFLAVYVLALVVAIAGVVHYV